MAWKHGEGSDYLFPNLLTDLIFLWGLEWAMGAWHFIYWSMGMGEWGWEIICLVFCFQTIFPSDKNLIKWFNFFTLSWKRGWGSDYLFFSLLTDLISLWGRERVMGAWYFIHLSMWMEEWGWEITFWYSVFRLFPIGCSVGRTAIFCDILFSKKISSNESFFTLAWKCWDERLFVS